MTVRFERLISIEKQKEKERRETLFKYLVVLALEYLFSVFKWRHGGHGGVQNNSEDSPTIMQNLSDIVL